MIHHLAPNGKIGLVLANGALSSKSSGEGEIRKKIIQADLVEGIVALPTQLFYSVTIPVTLWFISKDRFLIPSYSKYILQRWLHFLEGAIFRNAPYLSNWLFN